MQRCGWPDAYPVGIVAGGCNIEPGDRNTAGRDVYASRVVGGTVGAIMVMNDLDVNPVSVIICINWGIGWKWSFWSAPSKI